MKRWLNVVLLCVLVMAALAPLTAQGQGIDPAGQQARLRLAALTPEERVGQLFLVTFNGTDVSETSQIYDLIVNHHVGGVVLLAAHDNFAAAPGTVSQAYQLTAALQQIELNAPATTPDGTPIPYDPDRHIPLFIGISQEGGGYPNDQILSGVTALPSEMAVGATWDAALAEQMGSAMGRELAGLGFNLYLGLSLDVLSSPNPLQGADLGTRVFGGDPYWVSVMGRAFITGMHTGSENRIAVVARHFPGRGESDRKPEEEVATVRKSLEQLKQIELAPFFNVTGNAASPESAVDGLLVSHIRYQGFQGNIRATTRPVSFDAPALSLILGLPEFVTWRQNNGLMISDDLGSQAVRRFYDPGGVNFQARLVARDAFLAGNDLLYMGNIVSTDAPDNYTTLIQTLVFFTQKYQEDAAFAQRVDESVLRILTLKARLYGGFTPANVIPPQTNLVQVGTNTEVTFNIAQKAATLISPDLRDLDSVLPSAPSIADRMIFITDTRQASQCSTCEPIPVLPADALRNAVIRLYGPNAGGQVNAGALTYYTFGELGAYLDPQSTTPPVNMDTDLRRSNWIILSTLDLEPGSASIITLRRFLIEKQDILRNKNIILFSFSAPYYLDATDISRLTAYYGLYSHQTPFVDVAARLLFRELSPIGSLPVSMPGIGYDLISATVPDPAQVIDISLDLPPAPTPADQATPQPTAEPLYKVGDPINLRTGVIVDKNQRQVPDGTIVTFRFSLVDEGTYQTVESPTVDGIARASFRLDRAGLVEIRAASEPALESVTLQLNVTSEGSSVTVIPPTVEPTQTQPVTLTPTVTPEPQSNYVAAGHPLPAAWGFAMLMIFFGASAAYAVGSRFRTPRWGLRWALCVVVGGLMMYNYHSLGLVGSEALIKSSGFAAIWQLVLAGELAGLLIGWAWERSSTRQRRDQAQ